MSFVDEPVKREEKKYKRTEYMSLEEGNHLIRILQPKATKKFTHFIHGAYAECLGDEDCPICKNNKLLMMEYPDNREYTKQDGWASRSRRYYVNVLDQTTSVICPKDSKEFKCKVPSFCTCGESLVGMEPIKLNKIKVLSGGVGLFEEDLNSIEKAIVDETTQEPLGIMAYNLVLVVKGSGKERAITVIPQAPSSLSVDISGMELFNLDNVVIKLHPDEMLNLQRGISLKDIFAARNSRSVDVKEPVKTLVSESTISEINDRIASLFGGNEKGYGLPKSGPDVGDGENNSI